MVDKRRYEEGTFLLPVLAFRSRTRFRPQRLSDILWMNSFCLVLECQHQLCYIASIHMKPDRMSTVTSSFTVRIYYRTFRNGMKHCDLFWPSPLNLYCARTVRCVPPEHTAVCEVWGKSTSPFRLFIIFLSLFRGHYKTCNCWSPVVVKLVGLYHLKKVKQSRYRPGVEGSRKLRFPDFMTTAQDGGKVVSLTHRPPLHPGMAPGTDFCYRLGRPQGHSAIERILC